MGNLFTNQLNQDEQSGYHRTIHHSEDPVLERTFSISGPDAVKKSVQTVECPTCHRRFTKTRIDRHSKVSTLYYHYCSLYTLFPLYLDMQKECGKKTEFRASARPNSSS